MRGWVQTLQNPNLWNHYTGFEAENSMQLSRPDMTWCNFMVICSFAPNGHVNDMAMQMGKTNLLNQVPVGSKLLGKHNSETEEFLWEILDLQLCNAIVYLPFCP